MASVFLPLGAERKAACFPNHPQLNINHLADLCANELDAWLSGRGV